MNLTSYQIIPIATLALLSTSASAQNLVVDQTGALSGANGTTFISFGTGPGASVLDADTDTLAEFAVGDQLSLSFLLSFNNFNSAAASNSSFSYGFQGASDGLFYANLAGPEDLIAPTSELLTRPGSLFLGNQGTAIDGTANFSAEPQFTDIPTVDLAFTLDLLKTGAETYEFSLDIGGVNVSTQIATITDASVAGSTVITQLGFRNNNGLLSSPSLSQINATFTAVPEPSTTVFLIGLAALSGVFIRRFLKRRA